MSPVEKDERDRIRLALVELVAERGYVETLLPDLLQRAGTGETAFEQHYPSLEACFAEVWEQFVQELFQRALAVYTAAESWREGMRAQAWELFRFLSEDHLRARICVVEVNFGGELVQATRDRFMDTYVELIQLGRLEGMREDIPRTRAEAIFGAVWERVAAPVKVGEFDRLIEAVPEILYLLFLPYLGPEAAEEELLRGRREVARYRRDEL